MKKVSKSSKSNEKMFLNIRLPMFLMDRINSECSRLGMNKTAYIIMVLNSYFEGRDIMKLSGASQEQIDSLTVDK